MESTKKQLNCKPLSIALVCAAVLLLWALYRLVLGPLVAASAGAIFAPIVETVVKCLVFIAPALLLLRAQGENVFLPRKTLFSFGWKPALFGVGLSLAFLAVYVFKRLIEQGHFAFQFSLSFDDILTTILFAGITEEIFFRGWLYNTLRKKLGFYAANCIAAGVFVLSHFPIWYTNGYFNDLTFLSNCLSTFVIGFLLGYVVEESKSIWGAMFAHSMHNLIVTVLI